MAKPNVIDVERFWKWTNLLKATAKVSSFLDILETKRKRALNCTDIEESRNHLFKASQQKAFVTSICLLNQNKSQKTNFYSFLVSQRPYFACWRQKHKKYLVLQNETRNYSKCKRFHYPASPIQMSQKLDAFWS